MNKNLHTNEEILRAAHNVRKRILRFTIDRNGCYLGQACSASELLCTLYMRVLNLGPSLGSRGPLPFPGVPGPDNMDYPRGSLYNGPKAPELDRFFLSPAHYACVLYSVLVESGRMGEEALEKFNIDGWNMEMIGAEHSPGFENSAGSLAQTISIAAGTAHARKLKGETGKVYVLLGDGELEEGQIWEALQCAAFYKLDNLVVYVDANGHQLEGLVSDVMFTDNMLERFRAFGSVAVDCDGHDPDSVAAAAETPHEGKPLVIMARTSPTHGIPMLEKREPYLHFIRLKGDEVREAEEFYATM